jgi:hypothetical protein
MRRNLGRGVMLAAVLAVAGWSSPGNALASDHVVGIKMPRDIATAGFPAVYRVTTVNLPRLTGNYAPRWLMAQSAVGIVRARITDPHLPRRVWLRGASWNGGYWRLRYRVVTISEDGNDYSYGRFVLSRGDKRIKFNGYS